MALQNPPAIKPLGQVQLGTSLTTIYTPPTAPPNSSGTICSLWVCNTDTVARTATLRVGAGTLTVANSIAEDWSIPAKTTFFISVETPMINVPVGSLLQGLSDAANKVTVTAYGYELIS